MSPEVARFLADLLIAQRIHVGAPDFPEVADLCKRAIAELSEILYLAEHPDLAAADIAGD